MAGDTRASGDVMTGYAVPQSASSQQSNFNQADVMIGVPGRAINTRYTQRPPPTIDHRRPPASDDKRECTWRCWFWSIIAGLLISVMFAVFLISAVTPRPLQPDFSLVSASISSFNLSFLPTQLSADIDLTLSATNPNIDVTLHYHSLDAALLYRRSGKPIIQGSFPSFKQGYQRTTTVHKRLQAVNQRLSDSVASSIAWDLGQKALVLDLNVTTQVSFTPMKVLLDDTTLKMQCRRVTILFTAPDAGSMVDAPATCDILNGNEWNF